jgi:cell shape-determining protein MreC
MIFVCNFLSLYFLNQSVVVVSYVSFCQEPTPSVLWITVYLFTVSCCILSMNKCRDVQC